MDQRVEGPQRLPLPARDPAGKGVDPGKVGGVAVGPELEDQHVAVVALELGKHVGEGLFELRGVGAPGEVQIVDDGTPHRPGLGPAEPQRGQIDGSGGKVPPVADGAAPAVPQNLPPEEGRKAEQRPDEHRNQRLRGKVCGTERKVHPISSTSAPRILSFSTSFS